MQDHWPGFCPSMGVRSRNKGFDSFTVFIVLVCVIVLAKKNHNCQCQNRVDCRCNDIEMILYSINTAGYN